MIKYSTPNDLPRHLHEEETEESFFDVSESLVLLKEMLDKLFAEPSEDCLRKILEYSRSLNLR